MYSFPPAAVSLYGLLWELGICVELRSLDTTVNFSCGPVQPLHHGWFVISLCVAKKLIGRVSVFKAEEVHYATASLLFLMSTQYTQKLFQLFLFPSDLCIHTHRSRLIYAHTLVPAFTRSKTMAEGCGHQNIQVNSESQ